MAKTSKMTVRPKKSVGLDVARLKPGDKLCVVRLDAGYSGEMAAARMRFKIGDAVTLKSAHVHRWSTTLWLEEDDAPWSSVFFELENL
jgi:hypothetical protein